MTSDLLTADADTQAPAPPAAADAAPEAPASAASPDSSAETKGDAAPPEDGGSLLGDDLAPAKAGDGEQGGEAEAKGEDAPADEAAADFELEVPKDAHFSPDAVDKVKALAKEHGISKDAAQAILNEYDSALAATAETYQNQIRETFEGFGKAIQSDPKWGGKNLPSTKAYFAAAIDKYAPGYRQSLHDAGAMLEPEQYLAWAAVGKAMSESGGPITSSTHPKPEDDYSKSFDKTPAKYGGSLKE